ncbi:PAS domain S-box protein [Candidatus Chlorohelix sp.]|uniref:PAS domain S-box protein n=1 Tax=Candidatus Chlorohelix sp. TaxID=3139201 RepID=UPI00306E4997
MQHMENTAMPPSDENLSSLILQEVLESATFPCFSLDRNYCYTSFNKSHAQLMRAIYGVEIQMGQNQMDCINETDREIAKYNLDRAFSGTAGKVEAYFGAGVQSRHYLKVIHNPIRDSSGAIIGVVVLAQDLTHQNQMESSETESRERLQMALSAAKQGVFDLDLKTGIGSINKEYFGMLGYEPTTLLESIDVWVKFLHPDDLTHSLAVMNDCISGKLTEYRLEFRMRTKEGGWKWILSLGKVLARDGEGKATRIIGTHTDISPQKAAEERIRKLSDLYAALSQTNQAIIRIKSRESLFNEICRIAVEFGGLKMAWIGLLEPSGELIVPAAMFGEGLGYLDSIKISVSPDVPEGRGPTATVFRANHHYICNDFFNDPITLPWRTQAETFGIRASAVFPLLESGKVIGVLTLYSGEVGYFDNEIIQLLDEMVMDINFALEVLKNEATRGQTEKALQESEELFRFLAENAADMVFRDKLDGSIEYVSPVCRTLLGYEPEEMIGQLSTAFFHPEDRKTLYQNIRTNARSIEANPVMHRMLRKNGEYIWVETVLQQVIDPVSGVPSYFVGASRDISKRVKAEESLRESEERFHLVAASSSDMIWMMDMEGNFTYVSPAIVQLSGYTAEEVLKLNVKETMTPQSVASIQQGMLETIKAVKNGTYKRQGKLYTLEQYRKDGSMVWTEVPANPMLDTTGNLQGFLGITRDITERSKAEEAMRKSEEKFSKIFNVNPATIIITSQEGEILDMNPSACKLSGYTREECIGKNVTQIDGWYDPKRRALVGEMLFKQGYIHNVETSFRAKNGNLLQMLAYYEIIELDGVQRVLSLLTDVTEMKQAEKALRKSEEKLSKIFNSSPLPIVITKLESIEIVDANEQALAFFGYTREEFIGQTTKELNLLGKPELIVSTLETLKKQGYIHNFENEYLTKSGEIRNVIAFFELMELEGIPYVLAILNDITENKKAQEELTKNREQLFQAQKMETVGRLAGGVAHDFNNLLTIIRGYTDLWEMNLAENDPHREDLQEITKATQKAIALTHQLLSMSRRQLVQSKVVDLNELILDVEKMLGRLIGENIELVCELEKNLGKVQVDPSQIQQVILNLAVNARDAMPGGGRLKLRTYNVEINETYSDKHLLMKPGSYTMLEISDTGVGMDKETLNHIFEPFFTTKELGKGTGLGLSIVYGIVQRNEGHVWVYSEPTLGTIVKIYLPCVNDAKDAPAEKLVETKPTMRGTETILLVEDDVSILKLTGRILRGSGYKVLEAADGIAALQLVREYNSQIDLVVSDVIMPRMGGPELAKQLKTLSTSLKVLFMSGYTGEFIFDDKLIPDSYYIHKPFTREEFIHKIRALLDDPLQEQEP